jgi:hypothetical protein
MADYDCSSCGAPNAAFYLEGHVVVVPPLSETRRFSAACYMLTLRLCRDCAGSAADRIPGLVVRKEEWLSSEAPDRRPIKTYGEPATLADLLAREK